MERTETEVRVNPKTFGDGFRWSVVIRHSDGEGTETTLTREGTADTHWIALHDALEALDAAAPQP